MEFVSLSGAARSARAAGSGWMTRWLVCCLLLFGTGARADVVLLVEAPINFLGHVSSTGHAALLLDGLCSDDHLQVRLCRPCRPGEIGTVVSRYKGIDRYDWLAMPPGPYLFAVDSVDEVLTSASRAQVEQLRAAYRAQHPGGFKTDPREDGWEQLLGASYRRSMICIRVHTTAEQDQRLMLWLNHRKNRSHFNFFFNNCADFSRMMLNVLYPGAIHRSLFFDLGMTTPKQVVSCLHRYALRHPELQFEAYALPQVPGNIPRSGHVYGVTESFVKTKPFLLPVAVVDPIQIGGIAALGIADHRYGGKTTVTIQDGFFFRPETPAAEPAVPLHAAPGH